MNETNMLEKLVDIVQKYYEHTQEVPVLKHKAPQELREKIDLQIGEKGCGDEAFFQQLEAIALHTPKTTSKGFFNLLFGGSLAPAVMAEMLTPVLNTTMHTYKSAGIHILIEKQVIQFFLKKVGYENGDGTFLPGGSITNMLAILLARNEKDPSIKKKGIHNQRFSGYTSDQSHYSASKFTSILGLGTEIERAVPTDERGRMDPNILELMIQEDIQAGYTPFFVNATAGTTVLGAYDPLDKIAEIAHKYGLRMHVDAALGGGALMSKKYKHLLKGIEKSDSVSWNPHKMMNVPLLGAVILVKDPTVFKRNLGEDADYLFQMDDEDLNPGNKTLQCGRRNDALKVRAALKYLGEEGYETRIDNAFANAHYAQEIIEKDPDLILILPPECINVCFQVKGRNAVEICEKLAQEGKIMVSYGLRRGEVFIRMVCVNGDLTKKDIDYFFQQVKSV